MLICIIATASALYQVGTAPAKQGKAYIIKHFLP
jgi:hypothetical protein